MLTKYQDKYRDPNIADLQDKVMVYRSQFDAFAMDELRRDGRKNRFLRAVLRYATKDQMNKLINNRRGFCILGGFKGHKSTHKALEKYAILGKRLRRDEVVHIIENFLLVSPEPRYQIQDVEEEQTAVAPNEIEESNNPGTPIATSEAQLAQE